MLRLDSRGAREGTRDQLGGNCSGKGKKTCGQDQGVNIGIGVT